MKVTPKTENEIIEAGLWEAGEYDFGVIKAEAAVSGQLSQSPGTEYIKLNLQVFNAEGRSRFVDTTLYPTAEFKIRHFCVVGELMDKYESGELSAEDCVGVQGRLKLKIQTDKNKKYPPKNEVADFIVPKPKVAEAAGKAENTDDVPF